MKRFHLPDLVRAAALAAVAAAGAAAPPVLAGDNTPGPWHEDKIIGFRFRPLNEWAPVPAGTDPSDPKLCGFYSDKAKFDNTTVKPECAVYAFKTATDSTVATPGTVGGSGDGGKPTEAEMRAAFLAAIRQKSTREVFDAVRNEYQENANATLASMEEKKRKKALKDLDIGEPVEKKVKQGDLEITLVECCVPIGMTNGRDRWIDGRRIAAAWTSNEEYEVGVMYQIHEKSWKKYRSGVMQSLLTIEFLSGEDVAAARDDLAEALQGKTGDARWLEEIKRKVTPGWSHLQTKNYLLVYDKSVEPKRVELIARQIEAIRKDIYEVLFPADRPVTAISVVRVCKDKDQYHQYGGPGGSAGYWNWVDQELVFYEDTSAKKDALRVLNHEAFHQYIFYSVGNVSPHSWFNEGHGDYFSGHNYGNNGRFVAKPFSWRTGVIKSALGSKTYVPLKQFVTYTQQQYYANGGPNYAQGWSLVWFLRQCKDPEWKGILEAYFGALKGEVTKWAQEQEEAAKKDGTWKEGWVPGKAPDDVEERAKQKGLDAAFGGWDDDKWKKFEAEWKKFL
jgi:hypothetical protein